MERQERTDFLVRSALLCVAAVTVVVVTVLWQRAADQSGLQDPLDLTTQGPPTSERAMGASGHRSVGANRDRPRGSVEGNPGGPAIGTYSRHIIGTGVTAELLGSVGPAPAHDPAQHVLGNSELLIAGRSTEHVPAAVRQATGLETSEIWLTEDGDAVILAVDGGGELHVLTLHAGEHLADLNNDGVVNRQDLDGFLTAYLSRGNDADVDLDGTIRESDLAAFVKVWAER